MSQPQKGRSLVSWGCGEFGQHGHQAKPEDVGFLDGTVIHPAFNDNVALASCGSSHTVVATVDGDLYTWGNGSCGQLGTGHLSNTDQHTRIQLDPPPPSDAAVSSIACGTRHTMVLLTNGHVYGFGNNFFAQLGHDFQKETYKENQPTPGLLRYLVHYKVNQVACGDKHTLFLFQDGTVSAVGHNSHGQIGDGGRHEAVVPKSVDLDVPAAFVACGRNHSLVLTDSGDVYVWGLCKGCGHRRNDVLSPELKLQGRHIVQVAGGATHTLALAENGSIYSWGFGSDGQLGLGDRKLSSSAPKRVRHESLRYKVTYIGCGEAYSVAITRNGHLYMWGKNSHVISSSHVPGQAFFYPVAVDQDESLGPVHSVYCGSWHALVMTGRPDRQPTRTDDASDSDSGSDRELTSGSSVAVSSSGSLGAPKPEESHDPGPFLEQNSPVEKSRPPVGHQNRGGQSPTRSISRGSGSAASTKMCPPSMAGRGQTRLTLGEFYAMTDSSPSQNGSHSSKSQNKDTENKDDDTMENLASVLVVQVESPKEDPDCLSPKDETKSGNHNKNDLHKEDERDMKKSAPNLPPTQHRSAPPSAKSSSSSSAVSESSLKKRMAENLSANNSAFRTRDWACAAHQPRQRQLLNKTPVRSPSRHLPLGTPSPAFLSPRSPNLVPRARSVEALGSVERAHTMFISRTPAEQFLLPRREPTFMACHSLALVDLHDLRAGSVFDHEDNGCQGHEANDGQGQGHVYGGQGHNRSGSSTISRLDIVCSPAECDPELSQVFRQRTPLSPHHAATHPHFISASETPTAMSLTHQRSQDMLGPNFPLGQPESQSLFTSPLPNLNRQASNPLLRRSRTMYGQANRGAAKFYRKPGLPGATSKPITGAGAVRPLMRQSTSLDALPKHFTLNGGNQEQPPLDLAIFTSKPPGQTFAPGPRAGGNGHENVTNRRAVFSSASSWRSRQNTTLGINSDLSSPAKLGQLYLNGFGSKAGTQTKSKGSKISALEKNRDLTVVSAKLASTGYNGKIVKTFSDIRRENELKTNTQGANIKVKSVKKYC